jgi:hypothetical protein
MSDAKQLVDDRVIMLLYRLTLGERQGSATVDEIREFGVCAQVAMNTAIELEWVREVPPEGTIEVTSAGHEALEWTLAARRTLVFGGSVPDQGPGVSVLRPKWENLWQLQQRLTEADYERVLNAERYESVYDPTEIGFPGLVHYSGTLVYGEHHPLAGREIDPEGYPGEYIVTVVLRRQGAADNPKAIHLDAGLLEGDSHLYLPESMLTKTDAEGKPLMMTIQERSREGEITRFMLVPNRWGKLGKIITRLAANNATEAFDKAYGTLMPILSDLSYRYDVPLDILQVNVAERTTLTHTAQKMPDYREALLDENPFGGAAVDYSDLPLYTTFAYLYREGLTSSSISYGFLCFYKVIEGIRKLRRQRAAKGERRQYDNEKIEGEIAQHFPAEFGGKRFGYAIEKMTPIRDRIAHAFLDKDGPDLEQFDSLEERLKLETDASSYRAQAREIVRVMMHNEYWEPPPPL